MYVISAGLTDGRTIAMRLKGRRPHPDWPVSFPFECPKGIKRCPTREINDVENYLIHLLTSKEPLLQGNAVPFNTTDSYMERHVYVHEPDPEDEEDFPRSHPAVWVPPQVFLEFNSLNFYFLLTIYPGYYDPRNSDFLLEYSKTSEMR